MHVHCPGPCCMTKSVLHVHVHTACLCPCCMFMSMLHDKSKSTDIYIEMPECRTVRHPVSPDWKKLTMPKSVRYRTKLTQSGIFLVRYRTKIRDARMPMPALVSSMPMPSYNYFPHNLYQKVTVGLGESFLNILKDSPCLWKDILAKTMHVEHSIPRKF